MSQSAELVDVDPIGARLGRFLDRGRLPRLVGVGAASLSVLFVLRLVSRGRFGLLDAARPLTDDLFHYHQFGKATLLVAVLLVVVSMLGRGTTWAPLLTGRRLSRFAWAYLFVSVMLVLAAATLPLAPDPGLATLPVLARYGVTTTLFLAWQALVVALVAPKYFLRDRRVIGVFAALLAVAYGYSDEYLHWQIVDGVREVVGGATLAITTGLLEQVGDLRPTIAFDGSTPVLSAAGFSVLIGAQCEGYEGMLAALLLMGAFIAIDAHALRWARAIPLAITVIALVFIMNAVRIAALFYIGVAYSPDIALNGFHSYFGSLSLLCIVGGGMVALQHPLFREPVVRGEAGKGRGAILPLPDGVLEQVTPMVTPLAVYLLAGMLIGLLDDGFAWLYPLPVLVGAWVLFDVRALAREQFTGSASLSGVAVGVAVFVIWILMLPPDHERAQAFAATLFAAPLPIVVLWISFRVLGSSLVVPLLEELAFRGGLLRLAVEACPDWLGPQRARVVALLATSTAFGFLHDAFLAAMIAGCAYGLLALRDGRIGNAFIAHAVTNFMLCIYALGFGRWSYW